MQLNRFYNNTLFCIICIFVGTLNISQSACIDPYTIQVTVNNIKHELKLFQKNEDNLRSDVVTINKFVTDLGLNENHKIQLLEAALEYISMKKYIPEKNSGSLHFTFNSSHDALLANNRLQKTINYLNYTNDYPLNIWSTSTIPSYQICLLGINDFISMEIRKRGSYGPLPLLKQLIELSRIEYNNTHSESNTMIDIGGNIGAVSLYGAALGENVIAFEPIPSLGRRLLAGCILNGWCTGNIITLIILYIHY
jgi:hypothetical protein